MTSTSKLRAAGLSIILAWGWKRAAIALAAGALSALAMAPFNAWPVLFLTFPVAVWLIDGAAAGKWRGVPAAAIVGLLVRARLFRAGALLDRQRLPGRCADVRVADAVRGAGPAGLSRPVHRARFRAGAPDLDARRLAGACARGRAYGQRMAARPSADGIPLECLRLRAVGAAGAGADRLADRAVGHDVPRGCDLRQPGRADRRQLARAKAVDRAGGGAGAARWRWAFSAPSGCRCSRRR